MAIGMTVGAPLILISFFIIGTSIMEGDPCVYENRFRQTEWNGIVIKKYNDTPNHNYETLEIKNQLKTDKIQEWVVFSNGNFDRIEIGDSIAKNVGEITVHLFKNGQEQKLLVDYGCEN